MNDYSKPILPEFYDDCSIITKKYEKLYGRWNLDSQLLHIVTEVSELKDVLRNKNKKYGMYGSSKYTNKIKDELADVFLTSFATANYLGLSIGDLNAAILTKIHTVKSRVEELEKGQENNE